MTQKLQAELAHRYFENVAFPYRSYGNLVGQDPEYQAGENVLTSAEEMAKRRPGFGDFETTPTTFTGDILRQFVWRRWNGSFFAMLCEVTATASKVYKLEIGTDASYVLIHTDATSTEPFDFIVSSNFVFFGNGTDMKKYDGTTVTNWGIAAPAAAPTTAASGGGTLDATTGYTYVYAYGNSSTGHISSVSPESTNTGAITNNDRNITTVASTDAQVDEIWIFRSTDGGGGIWFAIANNPFTNTTGPHLDATPDTSLSSRTAPIGGVNDPPPPSYGFAYFANRIWMIDAVNRNKVWFTGWEEIASGVPEECVPSGAAGNFWAFGSEVNGQSTTEDSVLQFCAGSIYKITGDALDNFYRTTLAEGLGARQRAAIARQGRVTAWFDSSNSVWSTDGFSLTEIGTDIRPDLDGLNHSYVAACFFANKTYRWFCLLTGELMHVYDFDRDMWLIPWTVTGRAIASGETSSGTWDLLVGHGSKKSLKMTPGTFTDNGSAYAAFATTNLFHMADGPSRLSHPEYVGLETNSNEPSAVSILVDDDPTTVAMTAITANKVTPPLRTQGSQLLDNWYYARRPAGKRVSVRMDWPAEDSEFHLNSLDIATQTVGGR